MRGWLIKEAKNAFIIFGMLVEFRDYLVGLVLLSDGAGGKPVTDWQKRRRGKWWAPQDLNL